MEKKNKHAFFYFTKKEKNGIMVLLLFNLGLFFLPQFYDFIFPAKPIKTETLETAFRQLKKIDTDSGNNNHYSQKYTPYTEERPVMIRYKNFDPNTITEAEWKELGLKDKTIQTIQKYKSKGGRFRKPEDIKKIWGIAEKKCADLMPFVVIREADQNINVTNIKIYNDKKISRKLVDVNLADSSCFESIYGIGPALARRIILFRNKLGGFYEAHQVAEVWGLQDSIFQKIKDQFIIKDTKISVIDINHAPFETLKSHPYIGYKLAQAIINYRNQHGSFKSLEDIQKITLLNVETYNKIQHYLVTE